MLDFQAVGEQIHKLRVRNGYSQDGLAEVLYVTRQAVSRWELGQTLPSVDRPLSSTKTTCSKATAGNSW